MSYCRWSTDDFQCDLYCYENCNGGWTTHVAAVRAVWSEPLPPPVGDLPGNEEQVKLWLDRHNKVMELVRASPKQEIGLPYDGQSFSDPDLASFLRRLLHLKETGYRFPDSVIKAVRGEIADLRNKDLD